MSKFYMGQGKKLKKSKALLKKLTQIEDSFRDKLCEIYFTKCMINYKIKHAVLMIKRAGDIDCEYQYDQI